MRPASVLGVMALAIGSAPAAPIASAQTWEMVYHAYVAGMTAVELKATARFDARGYEIAVQANTVGLTRLFADSRHHNRAQGNWNGSGLEPVHYRVDGSWKGSPRRVTIEYKGGEPMVRELEPGEEWRERIPEADRRGTVDPVSVLALLSQMVARTNGCDGQARIFDGRKLEISSVRTGGWEQIARSHDLAYAGVALRCDFELRQIKGFFPRLPPAERARQAQPRVGTIWMADPAGSGVRLPVMVRIEIGWLGHATAYMTAIRRVE
jgi:hypothetical protein